MSAVLDRLHASFASGLAASVTESEGSLTLGFWSACGREMPIHVRVVATDRVLLSDDGETWGDLVGEGYSHPKPSTADTERLRELAKLYRVEWSEKERAFVALCTEADALDTARRITMASIALDGWRVWAPAPSKSTMTAGEIVQQAARAARKAGMTTERDAKLPSILRQTWQCPLLLRIGESRAAVRFDEAKADHVAEHASMFVADTETPAVIVTGEKTAAKLAGSLELRGQRIVVVAKLLRGTGRAVVDAARGIAA